MRNLSLAMKLTGSFGAIILLFLLLGGAALWSNSTLGGRLAEIGDVSMPALQGLALMQNNIHKVVEAQRSLMLPGLAQEARRTLLDEVDAARAAYKTGLDRYEKLPKSDGTALHWKEFRTKLAQAKDLNDRFFELEKQYQQTHAQDVHDRMVDLTMGDILTNNQAMFAGLDRLAAEIGDSVAQARQKSAREAVFNRVLSLLGTVLGTLAVVFLAAVTARYLSRNTTALVSYTRSVGEGILDAPLSVTASDEFGLLADGLRDMVGRLKEKMSECLLKEEQAARDAARARESAAQASAAMDQAQARQMEMLDAAQRLERVVESMTAATGQLAGQVQEVGLGVATQENRTAETATAMQQMNATVLEVSQNANKAAGQAAQAREKALSGRDIVARSKAAIHEVHAVARQLETGMGRLGEHARSIGRIMNVISDIADQTNLLALNAAIEAARAGDAGRGFAVVADEVRKLAEKTMAATKEVGQAITTIQDGIHDNIERVNQAAQAVETATGQAGESEHALREIVDLVNNTGDQIQSIAAASEEQSSASEQINRAVEEISQIASSISQGMSEATDAVDGISAESRELTALIASFRNNDAPSQALR